MIISTVGKYDLHLERLNMFLLIFMF